MPTWAFYPLYAPFSSRRDYPLSPAITPLRLLHTIITNVEEVAHIVQPPFKNGVSPTGQFGVTVEADLFNELVDAGTIQLGAGGVATLGGVFIELDSSTVLGGVLLVASNPVTLTVASVAVLSVAGWQFCQTARGNFMDSGIRAAEEDMVRRGAAEDVCAVLGAMLNSTKEAKDPSRRKRIVSTQKVNDFRDRR